MILLIDNYDSFTYNLYQALIIAGATVQVFRNDALSFSEIKSLQPSGIVISPGPGRPEEVKIGEDIVKYFAGQIPLLGVCLGHQIIIKAFGGNVIQADQQVHGKTSEICHHGNGIYQKLPNPFIAGRYHSLIADRTTVPDELMIDAETAHGLVMGVRHRNALVFGVQFHPESILTPQGDQLITNFVNLCE